MTADDREPAALPDDARTWLDHYAAVQSMPRGQFVRVGRAIHEPQRRVDRRPWIVGGLLVAAAAAMVWASGWLGRRELVADENHLRDLAEDRAAAVSGHAATEREPHTAERSTTPVPAELPNVTTPVRVAPVPPSTTTASRPAATPVAPPRPTLAEERALLEGAWRALAAGDRAGAKTIVQRHRTQFPSGQLTDVRQAIDAIVRCAALPPGDRSAVLEAYERDYPRAIVLQQVRDACAATK